MKNKLLSTIGKFTRKHHFPGMSRILNSLYSPENRERDFISTVVDYDEDIKINVNTSSFIEWEIFFKGVYEPHIENYIKQILNPGSVAIDVGANVGVHTVVMANRVGPNGKVFAFEPNKFVSKRLSDNIKLNNFTNVVLLNDALSDKDSSITLHAFREGTSRQGMASFYVDIPEGDRIDTMLKTKTFDSLVAELRINRIDFIKIDTEGNDFNILLGMKESIIRFRPEIIFEYSRESLSRSGHSWSDVLNLFNGLGYSLSAITSSGIAPILNTMVDDFDNILAKPRLS